MCCFAAGAGGNVATKSEEGKEEVDKRVKFDQKLPKDIGHGTSLLRVLLCGCHRVRNIINACDNSFGSLAHKDSQKFIKQRLSGAKPL